MLIHRTSPTPRHRSLNILPDYIADSVVDIDFNYLQAQGITGCLIDLDGTVVERGSYDVVRSIGDTLKQSGMAVFIATNRPRGRDLQNLQADLGAKGVIHPRGIFAKPTKRYFAIGLHDHGLQPERVVMVGDRYFQDIYGANRSGIQSILVRKMISRRGPLDHVFTSIEALLTKLLSRFYRPVQEK